LFLYEVEHYGTSYTPFETLNSKMAAGSCKNFIQPSRIQMMGGRVARLLDIKFCYMVLNCMVYYKNLLELLNSQQDFVLWMEDHGTCYTRVRRILLVGI
jgi:hypothetical protein